MEKKAVEIEELSVVMGKNIFAVKTLDAGFVEGRIIGLVGPSGSGKTTLMKAIVGTQKISNGTVEVFGLPAGVAKLRKQISYMPQKSSIYYDLTVHENIDYFAKMYGIKNKKRKHQVDTLLKTLHLQKVKNRLARSLSEGQMQLVSMAVALLGSPKLIILDEPTVGLDPALRDELWSLFKELANNGKTIIFSSHVVEEAERCDDLLFLREGMLLAYGSPQELCNRTNSRTVQECYLKLERGER